MLSFGVTSQPWPLLQRFRRDLVETGLWLKEADLPKSRGVRPGLLTFQGVPI